MGRVDYIWYKQINLNTPINDRTYQADPQMLYSVIRAVRRLKRDCYFCDIVLLVYTAFLYNKYANDIQTFIYWEVGIVLLLGFIQYKLIAGKGNFINKSAIEVSVTDGYIYMKTAAFGGPFWFKKESAELKFEQAKTNITQVVNPYISIFKADKQVTKLRYKGKDAYIINGYYNWRLEEDLADTPS